MKIIKLLMLCGILSYATADENYALSFSHLPASPLKVGQLYHLTIEANYAPDQFNSGGIVVTAYDTRYILNLDAVNGCQIKYLNGNLSKNYCRDVVFFPMTVGKTVIQVSGVANTNGTIYPTIDSPVITVVQ